MVFSSDENNASLFEVEKNEEYAVMHVLTDKLDTNVAPKIKSELVILSGKGAKNMIIDLQNSRYCDSSGLSAILVANRLCKNNNGIFVLTGLQAPVERLINISQLDTVLNIKPTFEDGLTFLKKKMNSDDA